MDKEITSNFLLLSLMILASSAFEPLFGPPNVTLTCSVDYATLSKVVKASWMPTLVTNETSLSTELVSNRIQNCEASIRCSGGYSRSPHGCTFNKTTSVYFMEWEFTVPFHETHCSVEVQYYDFEDWRGTQHVSHKNCTYSTPNSTVLMQKSPVSATVGKLYWIQCSVYTSDKISSSIVKIEWSGPHGSITNDSRINVHQTVSDDGLMHNGTLQFLYLSENDTGEYTCNVKILDATTSQALQLDNITIPTPNVSVTAIIDQALNDSLMLECSITTVRGITSSVDIVWMANDTIIRRMNNSLGDLVNNIIKHRDVYHISDVGSDRTQYHCHAVINESLVVTGSFLPTKPSANVSLPVTVSTSPTTASTQTGSNSIVPTENSIPTENSTTNSSAATVSSNSSTTVVKSSNAGSAQVVIIISAVIGFLLVFVLIGAALVYKFRRELYSKNHYSKNNNDVHFKAPSISEFGYSITDKDNLSTCENLDMYDKVAGWIKTVHKPSSSEECDGTYPSNEEILNYVCGQNIKHCTCDSRSINESVKSKDLSKAEEGLSFPSNQSVINDDFTISVLHDDSVLEPHNRNGVPVFCDKVSNQNIQTKVNNIEDTEASPNKVYVTLNSSTTLTPENVCILHNSSCYCHPHPSENNNSICSSSSKVVQLNSDNSAIQQDEDISQPEKVNATVMSHTCNNERTNDMESANSDQLSLDSSDKLTEDTMTSSVSSYSISTLLVEGEYIENKASPMHSAVNTIPINYHQNSSNSLDDKMCTESMTTCAAVGEYVDRNIAV